ncbi:hypothetical protein Ae201684P_019056 [Aphanomyces euteiches]|uniref:Uncharacterized protein n=1 Tax=Aphanomyces euteiches TaxID=100861 RepID=A0A6G0WEM4_9STRA|nr:hypothetical protein Ae201684_015785 [Aphanomyces euteiches]KAH9100053.1 hypothetical protein Ae201684P_019056 [Aphanomyces euteiches]
MPSLEKYVESHRRTKSLPLREQYGGTPSTETENKQFCAPLVWKAVCSSGLEGVQRLDVDCKRHLRVMI